MEKTEKMEKKQNKQNKNTALYILMGVTALLITAAGIRFGQPMLRILPLYVSLVINFLQSRLNRYGSLLGGLNSVLYALVYLYFKLYATAVYAVVVSCPLQIITFIRWSKRPWGKSTVLKVMTARGRVLLALGMAVSWGALYFVLKMTGSEYALFDNSITLLGILNSFLLMFAYVEYTYLILPGCLLNIGLYITMLQDKPEQWTYLIFSVYSLVCQIIAFVNARRMYAQQQAQARESLR